MDDSLENHLYSNPRGKYRKQNISGKNPDKKHKLRKRSPNVEIFSSHSSQPSKSTKPKKKKKKKNKKKEINIISASRNNSQDDNNEILPLPSSAKSSRKSTMLRSNSTKDTSQLKNEEIDDIEVKKRSVTSKMFPHDPSKVSSDKSKKSRPSATSIEILQALEAIDGDALVEQPQSQLINALFGNTDQIGIEIFNNVDQMWLEYTYNHVGPTLPSPYEYDVFDVHNTRIFQVRPIYTSGFFEREKHRIGKPSKGFGAPNEFSCHSDEGLKVCYFSYATKNVRVLCRRSIPELKMDIFVEGVKVGRVNQNRRTISLQTGEIEVMEIQNIPTPGGRCNNRPFHNFVCSVFFTQDQKNNPAEIGVVGRNGITEDLVVMGNPLGFYCDVTKLHQNEEVRKLFGNLHRVLLLAVTVGFMTLYTSLKLR